MDYGFVNYFGKDKKIIWTETYIVSEQIRKIMCEEKYFSYNDKILESKSGKKTKAVILPIPKWVFLDKHPACTECNLISSIVTPEEALEMFENLSQELKKIL